MSLWMYIVLAGEVTVDRFTNLLASKNFLLQADRMLPSWRAIECILIIRGRTFWKVSYQMRVMQKSQPYLIVLALINWINNLKV